MIDLASHNWHRLKTFVEYSLSFSDDSLHVAAGVAIQLLVAALLRTSVARFRPWAVVLVLEILNEASDLRFERWPDLYQQLGEGTKDVLLTMALPTLLLLVARRWPRLLAGDRN